MLQCVAVCCSMLQCVVTWLVRVDWCVTLCYSMLHGDALCCIAFQCIATWPVQVDGCAAVCCACCRVLHCAAVLYCYQTILIRVDECVALCCMCVACALQYVAVRCSALQCVAVRRSVLLPDKSELMDVLLTMLSSYCSSSRMERLDCLPTLLKKSALQSALALSSWTHARLTSITREYGEGKSMRLSGEISQKARHTVMNLYAGRTFEKFRAVHWRWLCVLLTARLWIEMQSNTTMSGTLLMMACALLLLSSLRCLVGFRLPVFFLVSGSVCI